MKKILTVLLISCATCILAFSETAQAANKARPFQSDNPYFINNGKIVLPTSNPTSVTKYKSGRVAEEFYAGPVLWGWFQSGTTYKYMDEGPRTKKGRVYQIIEAPDPSRRPFYTIEYYGRTKNVKTIKYADSYWGREKIYDYNKDGTLKSFDHYETTGFNYGHVKFLEEHKEYKYTYYRGSNKIKSAERTTITYSYTGQVVSTVIDKEYFDRQGNAVPAEVLNKIKAASNELEELNQKLTIIEEITNNNSLPNGVVVVSNMAGPAHNDYKNAK